MLRYKVILVDDEEHILYGMKKDINWDEAGYEVIGTASNGVEAWELIQNSQPDVVISDIHMPFMDGLQLAERISKQLTKTKVILFSKFTDFDYAQQAVRYQVFEYMLKPVKAPDWMQLLARLREDLDQDIKNAQDAEYMRQMYEEHLPVMRGQFLQSLVEGRIDADTIEAKLQEYGLTFDNTYYTAVVAQTDPLPEEEPVAESQSAQDLYIRKLIEEMLQKISHCISFTYYGKLVFLCAFAEKHQLHTTLQYLREAVDRGRRFYHVTIYCGVGARYQEKSMLAKSFQEAQNALEYSILSPNMPINYIKDVVPDRPDKQKNLYEGLRKHTGLLEAIRNGSEEQITALLAEHYKRAQSEQVSLNIYQNLVLEILLTLQNIVYLYDLYEDKYLFHIGNSLQQMLTLSTGEQLQSWLRDYCLKLSRAIRSNRMNSNQLLAQRAKEYIDNHFAEADLSVETMCDYLHVSSSHFSTTFSRENGITFIGYLTERRLAEAERLLRTTDYKTREIAEKVGYPEPNYFSYVFKKNKKISPVNYRKKFEKNA